MTVMLFCSNDVTATNKYIEGGLGVIYSPYSHPAVI